MPSFAVDPRLMVSIVIVVVCPYYDIYLFGLSSAVVKTLNIVMLRPMCVNCGERPGRSAGLNSQGVKTWRKYCSSCDSAKYRKQRLVDTTCVSCGFVAQDVCQMDSVDGQAMCSNCNRLRVKRIKQQQHNEYQLTVDATVDWANIRL